MMDYLKDKTFWNWIDTHISYDPNDLALRYAHKNEWIDFAILQVHLPVIQQVLAKHIVD